MRSSCLKRRPLRRSTALLAIATAAVAGSLTLAAPAADAATITCAPGPANASVGAFLSHLNGLRARHGLPGLALAGDLSSIAQAHTRSMAAQGTIFHNGSLTTQVSNWQTLGENVGEGPTSTCIDTAFDGSPDHYRNEVNNTYTQVGIGVATAGSTIYVTLDFRMPMHGSSNTAPPPVSAGAPSTVKHRSSGTTSAANNAAASNQAAAARAAQVAAARIAARAAAINQAALLTPQLKQATDPLARAVVFSARVNTVSQTG